MKCVECGAGALRRPQRVSLTLEEAEENRQTGLPPEGLKLRKFMTAEGFTYESLRKHLRRKSGIHVHDRTLRATVYNGRCGYELAHTLGRMMRLRGHKPAELWPGCNMLQGKRTPYRTDYWAWYDSRVLDGLMEENPKWPVPRSTLNKVEKYGTPRPY